MAAQEMREIRSLDTAFFLRQGARLLVYASSGALDGWVPQWQVTYLRAVAATAPSPSEAPAVLNDQNGIPHAFVNGNAGIVGSKCVMWAEQRLKLDEYAT